jgi:predicted DNA-binding antitoxin AbrB/MazE fold protein
MRRYPLIMTIHTDAIYESGVFRPLTPLDLKEHQVVSLAISTAAEAGSRDDLIRDHSAFLNSYAPEDEGLYDDYSAG